MAVAHAADKIGDAAHPARGHHRHRHCIGNYPGQRQIVAGLGAVAIHRGEQDFARTQLRRFDGIGDRVDAGRLAAAVGENFPLAWANGLGVHRHHHALFAEPHGEFTDQRRARDGGAVHRHLVGTGQQQSARILHGAHAATHGERHEALIGGALDDIEQRAAIFVGGGDVEEAEFVSPGRIIGGGGLNWIAGITQRHEVDALDHAAIGDIEAGDDADGQCHAATLIASARSSRPS